MFIKKILNHLFCRGLRQLFFWRVKYQESRTKKNKDFSRNSKTLLILTSQPDSTLKPGIWELIQTHWKWENEPSVTIKQIVPALPFNHPNDSLITRFSKHGYYLWRKFLLAGFIIWQIGHSEGIVLETLFSYKGERFLEELFLGCFQKTVLDVGQIQLEVQALHNQADLVALDQKIHQLQDYFSLSSSPAESFS